jgi:potassium efflux system protein
LLIVLFFTVVCQQVHSSPTPPIHSSLVEYLNKEQAHLHKVIDEVKQASPPKNGDEYLSQTHKIDSLLTITKAKIESLQAFHDNSNKIRLELNQKLKHLQQLPLASADADIQERVNQIENSLVENRKISTLNDENLELTRQFQNELNAASQRLEMWNENYELAQKLKQIKQSRKQLLDKLAVLYQGDTTKSNDKHAKTKILSPIDDEARALINNQYIALIHHQMNTLDLQKNIVKAKMLLLQNSNIKTLQYMVETYADVLNQSDKLENSLKQMLVFSNSEASLDLDISLKKSITNLKTLVNEQIRQVADEQKVLAMELSDYQSQLKKLASSRQSLSDYSIASWPIILNRIGAIPVLFYSYTKTLTLKVYDSYMWLDVAHLSILWGLVFAVSLAYFGLNRFLKSVSLTKERSRLSGYLYDGILTLVQRNIPYLCFISTLWILMYCTNISYSNYQLLFSLFMVWFTFRVLILIARLGLLERISDSSGKDVKLYYRLKWLLLFGGWITALMTFSHLLPLSLLIQDLFNRLFMLFLLTVSLVAWKSKDVISYLIRPMIIGKKRYFKNAISLLVMLIPLTLFSTAVIGLFGFVNLAWTLSVYQAYALTVLVGYILARGLLFDALEYISEAMISSLNNGWLWIEVFLKPADKILRVVLLLMSIAVLFQLFGWHSDSLVIQGLHEFAQYTLINLNGIHITVTSTIEFFISVAVFVWAAIWTREFCFRWLFKKTKDAAIRNSLSVFTQYAVILIGSFITLRILGLDFSGMSVIIGGLAVGMGFGLRDFASNIVGGIMLLIERPVREGDLITIGEYEGQVSHIGIRCMRVSSWDNTEVLIPNAETFNKPFTNWTHQDGIVRTVIPIKVSRSDDPVMVQQLILDVLAIIPEIVPDPPAQVFLKKIDEALIEFEVRYFINVQNHSRVEVRSAVLFAITAQFKAAGIRPPIEPLTIEFKEGHGEFITKKATAED